MKWGKRAVRITIITIRRDRILNNSVGGWQLAAALGGQDRDPQGRALAARAQTAAAKEEYANRLLRAKVIDPHAAVRMELILGCAM